MPSTVLELVDSVVKLYAAGLQPPKGRLAVADLRSHAQLHVRAEFAALAHRIAALAQGVLAMERSVPHSFCGHSVRLMVINTCFAWFAQKNLMQFVSCAASFVPAQ